MRSKTIRKTLIPGLCGLALCGCLGATWPSAHRPAQDKTKQITCASPRLAKDLWQESCYFALIDSHLDEFVQLLELPKGWVANGSVWNHHETPIRTIGMLNENGAASYILVGPEERVPKAAKDISDEDIIKINSSWEKIIFSMHSLYVPHSEKGDEKVNWSEYPAEKAQRLHKISSALGDIRRGQYLKLYTLTKDAQTPQINVALIVNFDLFESKVNGKVSTLLRDRQVLICFVPEDLNFNDIIVDTAKVGLQTEKVNATWDRKISDHMDVATCSLPAARIYGITTLNKEIIDLDALPYTLGHNIYTGERVRVPTTGSSCWVDEKGNYMYMNSGAPHDFEPLNKWSWRRVK